MAIFNVTFSNTDHKLTQANWSEYTDDVFDVVSELARVVLGEYYSPPNSPFQQGIVVFSLDYRRIDELKERLVIVREKYGKNHIYWSATQTEKV